MRSIHANIIAELQAKELRPFMLFHMEIDATHYRITDCDVPLVTGGNSYDPLGFKAQPVTYSMDAPVDEVTVEIDNINQVMTNTFVGGTPQGEPADLSLVVLDSSYAIIEGPVTLFEGEIDDWTLDEERLTVTLTNIFTRWSQRTLSKHSASCRWKVFKGDECRYLGTESWCDRTYARCIALGNTDNFGGFRWLPSIVDKEIWWGRLRGD